jgi:hypothetical protein
MHELPGGHFGMAPLRHHTKRSERITQTEWLCVRRLFSIVTVALCFEYDALRGSTIALRVAPFLGDAVGSPPKLKYKTTSKVGHVIVGISRTFSLVVLLVTILDDPSLEAHASFLSFH